MGLSFPLVGSLNTLAPARQEPRLPTRKQPVGGNLAPARPSNPCHLLLLPPPQVYSAMDNVAGVKIPKFESVSQPGDTKMDLTGGRRGGGGRACYMHECVSAMWTRASLR
jgi:hypothetical protein